MQTPSTRRTSILPTLCLVGALFGCSSTGSSAMNGATEAPSYVVVHGAWSGAWAWDAVAAELRANGKDVTVVELPAHGADVTPIADATLDAYAAKVESVVDAASGPVVLIGHSLGGMIISQVAEHEPDKIAKLVFVAGFFPKDGDTALALAMNDPDTHLGNALNVDQSQGTADVDPTMLIDVFCADCSTAEQSELQAHYRTEPVAPLATPVHITAANWGSVAKYYVYTQQDHAISYSAQQTQTADGAFVKTALLDSSHSPFLSEADDLTNALLGF